MSFQDICDDPIPCHEDIEVKIAMLKEINNSYESEYHKHEPRLEIIVIANLTINVISPPTVSETFTAFWVTYGTLGGVVVGTFSTFFIDYLKRRRERK